MESTIKMIEKEYAYPFKLHSYQYDAAKVLSPLRHSALYASVGTGKTAIATTIALLKSYNETVDNIIIVCPPILIPQWLDWLQSLDGPSAVAYRGTVLERKKTRVREYDFTLLSIQILKNDYDRLMEAFKGRKILFVIDECQLARNYKTGNHRLIKQVSLNHETLMMTGTPIANPLHVFGLTRIYNPMAYPSLKRFQLMHVAKFDFWQQPSEYVNLDVLHKNLLTNAYTIDGDDVLELPPIIETVVPYDLSPEHMRLYKKLVDEQLIFLQDEVIDATQTTRLYHKTQEMVLNPGRFQDEKTIVPVGYEVLDECIDELALGETDEKLAVFCNYRLSNEGVHQRILSLGYDAVLCYGGENNEKNVRRFLTDPKCKVLVGSPLSIGVGLNLQSVCRYIICMELPLSPNTYDQIIGRVYREGQKKKCIIKIAVANNTIQRHLLHLVRDKASTIQKILPTKKNIANALIGV